MLTHSLASSFWLAHHLSRWWATYFANNIGIDYDVRLDFLKHNEL